MNYTPNHHLPQWVPSDRVRMEDFNQMNQSIEQGLTDAVSKADSARSAAGSAASTASTALARANAAQSAANAAQTAADEAKAAASEIAAPYVAGSYTGTGKNIHITLGFRPSFLVISGMKQTRDENPDTEFTRYFALTGGAGTNLRGRVQLLSDGFSVYFANNNGLNWPMLTDEGRDYYYIAFR